MSEEKYFILNRGSLSYRLDPEYYHVERRNELEKLKNSGVKLLPLNQAARIIKKVVTETSDNLVYVGLEDVESNTCRFLNNSNKESFGSALSFERNDILYSKLRPYLNKVYLAEFDGVCSTEFVILRTKAVSPKFLAIYLSSENVVKQTKHMMSGNTLPRLQTEDIHNLLIPILDSDKQDKVESLYIEAQNKRDAKEGNAKLLLHSIDDYLLNELGITLPEKGKNDIFYRSFKTHYIKVTGNRFDPKCYSAETENLYKSIEGTTFSKIPLKRLIVHSVSGDWGEEFTESYNEKLQQKCLVIRATEFDNDFNLRLDNSRVKYRLISRAKLKKLDIQPNDFLLEKSGGSPDQPVGRIALLDKEIFLQDNICYSNFIHKFRVDTNRVLPEYLFCFLKLIHNIKLTDAMQSQTNGIRNLIMREYWNQSIPLPDLGEQRKIAAKYTELKTKAQSLLKDAKDEFLSSKNEIEKLILA